jgi:hypothetical protein
LDQNLVDFFEPTFGDNGLSGILVSLPSIANEEVCVGPILAAEKVRKVDWFFFNFLVGIIE